MKIYPALSPDLTAWALRQPVFFVASAPRAGQHVNVSPKGMAASTFRILSATQAAYLDRTGSGCETLAHVYENGRVTLMFMSLGGAPRILRLFCRGRVVEWDRGAEVARWLARMGGADDGSGSPAVSQERPPRPDALRAVIVLDIWRVTTSCGYGVPRVRPALYAAARADEEAAAGAATRPVVPFADELSVFEERPTLAEQGAKRVRNGTVLSYQVEVNRTSLDGLPGLRVARREAGEWLWVGDARAWARRVAAQADAVAAGFALAVLLYGLTRAVAAAYGPVLDVWLPSARTAWT